MDSTFLRWAGGKNWFVKNQGHRLPSNYDRYIDPFLGGGSIFFHLEPKKAILSDVNAELIATYKAIKDDWGKLDKKLREHERRHSKEYYYEVRGKKPRENAIIGARMIYLNRTCFNGIYRVNRSGGFNVPIGSKSAVTSENDQFEARSKLLQNATIQCCDFETTIEKARESDFLFCDPPYAIQKEQSFVGYTQNLFNWSDQVRLADALKRAKKRGVIILMTNVNHDSVRSLYEGLRGFSLDEVTRFSSISGKSGGRRQYSELIVSANM